MTRRRCSSEMKRTLGLLDDAAALDVDVVAPVDHDLGDGGVGEELLDRTEAHHVTGDVLHETLTLLVGERRLVGVHEGADLGHHHRLQLILVLRLEEAGPRRSNRTSWTLTLKSPSPSTVGGRRRRMRRLAPLARLLAWLMRSVRLIAATPSLRLVGVDRGEQLRQLLHLLGDRRLRLAA